MTATQLRNDMSSSLKMISKHVKYIRRYKRTQRQEREFLEAFEQNFLDSIYTIVSSKNPKTKEETALRHIKIVHYNSARACLEDIIRRITPSWRRFKGNKDLFVNISLSDALFNQFLKQWNDACDIVRKTRSYRDEDKIKDPGKFDGCVDALIAMESHIEDALNKCRFDRWWRVIVSYIKPLWLWLIAPIAVIVLAAIIMARFNLGKNDNQNATENCQTKVLRSEGFTSSNEVSQIYRDEENLCK